MDPGSGLLGPRPAWEATTVAPWEWVESPDTQPPSPKDPDPPMDGSDSRPSPHLLDHSGVAC